MCARCEELEEENRYLKDELGLRIEAGRIDALRRAFGLTKKQATLALLLANAGGRCVSPLQIEEALLGIDGEASSTNYVRVFVSHVRKRLADDAIETVWGDGYRMSPAWRRTIQTALEGQLA